MHRTRFWKTNFAWRLAGALVALAVSGPARAQTPTAAHGGGPSERHGLQVVPFVGVHSDLYTARVGYGWSDAGLLAGVIAGARMGERASLNGQLAYHSTG